MSKDTGGPVFPCRIPTGAEHAVDEPQPTAQHYGLTLRDYFAAKALWGVLNGNHLTKKQMAEWSYEMADQMLKSRDA